MLEFLGEINNQLVVFFGVGIGSLLLAVGRSVLKEHKCRIIHEMEHKAEIQGLKDDIGELRMAAAAGEKTHDKMWVKISKIEQDISFIRGHMAQG